MKALFICELSKKEQFEYYKKIKSALIENGVFDFENLENAMNSKIRDIEDLI